MTKMNKKIIKEQNIASKSGKFINKAEALRRVLHKEEEAKKPK